MAKQQFLNNTSVPILEFLSIGDTIITVGNDFGAVPVLTDGDWYIATIVPAGGEASPEIVKITAVNGNDLTVERGQEGTAQRDYIYGATLQFRITAGSLNQFSSGSSLEGPDGSSHVGFIQAGVGAQPRTVESKLRDAFNIDDFGAIGDGTLHPLSERYNTLAAAQLDYPFATSLTSSIDWAAIQAALNQANALGVGEVQVTKKKLVINEIVFCRANVKLVGDYVSSVTQPNGRNLDLFFTGAQGANGGGIHRLIIDGNRDNNNVDFNAILIHPNISHDFTILDNYIKNGAGYGIVVNSGQRMTVKGNTIENMFMHFIGVYGVPNNIPRHLIQDNRFIRGGAGGLILGMADYSIVQDNTLYSPIIGTPGNRMTVNINGTTVTWNSGPDFTNVRVGEILVVNNGMEFRIMAKNSNTSLTIDSAGPTLTNAQASIGMGDLVGIMSQFVQVIDNAWYGGATFGIGCTVGGNAVSTIGNRVCGNILVGQGKHALAVGYDVGAGGIYDNVFKDNVVYGAGASGGIGTLDRVPFMVTGGTLGKVNGLYIDGNYIVGVDGDGQNYYWLGFDTEMEVSSVVLGRNYANRMQNPGILNDIREIALSGWGNTATASNIVSYGHSVRFNINCTGTGQTASPAITVTKVSDSPERPAMVDSKINSTNGSLALMWGEQSTTAGQWRATYFGTPVSGNVFTISMTT